MATKLSLNDISHQIYFENLENRPKFKLLLVKNDKEMKVLQNQAFPQEEEEWKKQVFEIDDDFYLLHIVDKQIQFNKSFEKYAKDDGIEFRLINQQSALHVTSLVEELKQAIAANNNNRNKTDDQNSKTTNGEILIEENESDIFSIQQPTIQINHHTTNNNNYQKCHKNYKNHNNNYYYYSTDSKKSNSPQKGQRQEESKIQIEQVDEEENFQQDITSGIGKNQPSQTQTQWHLQQNQQQQQQQQYQIRQLINQATQEYLNSHTNLDDLVYWKLDLSISMLDSFQQFHASEVEQVMLQCSLRLEKLLENRKQQLIQQRLQQTDLVENSNINHDNSIIFQKPLRKRNQHIQNRKIFIAQPSPSPSNKSGYSNVSQSKSSINSNNNSTKKMINENKFAPDEVSNQLASTNQAKKKLIKNQQQGERKDKKKQQQLPSKKQQQQITKNAKHQQTLLFDSQGMTRSQLKKLTEINKFA